MIRWLTLTDVANECGFKDPRTFKKHYMDKYPPDRTNAQLKWWKETTVDRIKEVEFSDAEIPDGEGA
ncbi:MAG: hypothetical protein ACTH7L_01605 [Psychrobacter alimentarius]